MALSLLISFTPIIHAQPELPEARWACLRLGSLRWAGASTREKRDWMCSCLFSLPFCVACRLLSSQARHRKLSPTCMPASGTAAGLASERGRVGYDEGRRAEAENAQVILPGLQGNQREPWRTTFEDGATRAQVTDWLVYLPTCHDDGGVVLWSGRRANTCIVL